VAEYKRLNPNGMGFPPILNHFLSGWHHIEDIPTKADLADAEEDYEYVAS